AVAAAMLTAAPTIKRPMRTLFFSTTVLQALSYARPGSLWRGSVNAAPEVLTLSHRAMMFSNALPV
ncbi:MAG: hypothetical protein ACRCTX_24785, partial [Afipia sp.]